MSNELEIYEKVRKVPENAKKKITGGRLNGLTDISPMWRIKILTELFGVCGFGWYYKIIDKWIEPSTTNEISAFVQIELYIKHNGEWSNGIVGIGGSSYVTTETKGLRMNDEAYKMALTDAISVSCKQLGIGADVYWDKDNTKYTNYSEKQKNETNTHEKQIVEKIQEIGNVQSSVLVELKKSISLCKNISELEIVGETIKNSTINEADKLILKKLYTETRKLLIKE